ncbi:MAG: single-stranded-DNA-specific exonuclease RecJ, partial [Acidobacteria bacterium]|nr:single-stranded-DNA-specific exonuclease RecJ [Acidobacteriota bacterium]
GLEHEVPQFLKIAAIGTVADIMDLTGENRAIVALGLVDLQRTDNVGLRALMDVAECNSAMTSYHIGFRIGPRINAAGRMDVAKHVIELLECDDPNTAAGLARLLDSRNRERQQMQQRITELALNETESHYGKHFIVVAGEGWHRGVIGLAASRIAEKLYRPTIVLSLENGTGHGSARSIANFHLVNALSSCTELFEAFGGHAAAAGMTIRTDNIDALRRRLNEYASALLTDEDLVPCLEIDALLTPQSLDLELVGHLAAFEPFGAGNPKPVFLTRGLALRDEPMVLKDKHLKFRLFSEADRAFEAVWWDGVERSKGQTFQRGSRIEIAYVPEVNHWQGNRSLQLVIEDLKVDN